MMKLMIMKTDAAMESNGAATMAAADNDVASHNGGSNSNGDDDPFASLVNLLEDSNNRKVKKRHGKESRGTEAVRTKQAFTSTNAKAFVKKARSSTSKLKVKMRVRKSKMDSQGTRKEKAGTKTKTKQLLKHERDQEEQQRSLPLPPPLPVRETKGRDKWVAAARDNSLTDSCSMETSDDHKPYKVLIRRKKSQHGKKDKQKQKQKQKHQKTITNININTNTNTNSNNTTFTNDSNNHDNDNGNVIEHDNDDGGDRHKTRSKHASASPSHASPNALPQNPMSESQEPPQLSPYDPIKRKLDFALENCEAVTATTGAVNLARSSADGAGDAGDRADGADQDANRNTATTSIAQDVLADDSLRNTPSRRSKRLRNRHKLRSIKRAQDAQEQHKQYGIHDQEDAPTKRSEGRNEDGDLDGVAVDDCGNDHDASFPPLAEDSDDGVALLNSPAKRNNLRSLSDSREGHDASNMDRRDRYITSHRMQRLGNANRPISSQRRPNSHELDPKRRRISQSPTKLRMPSSAVSKRRTKPASVVSLRPSHWGGGNANNSQRRYGFERRTLASASALSEATTPGKHRFFTNSQPDAKRSGRTSWSSPNRSMFKNPAASAAATGTGTSNSASKSPHTLAAGADEIYAPPTFVPLFSAPKIKPSEPPRAFVTDDVYDDDDDATNIGGIAVASGHEHRESPKNKRVDTDERDGGSANLTVQEIQCPTSPSVQRRMPISAPPTAPLSPSSHRGSPGRRRKSRQPAGALATRLKVLQDKLSSDLVRLQSGRYMSSSPSPLAATAAAKTSSLSSSLHYRHNVFELNDPRRTARSIMDVTILKEPVPCPNDEVGAADARVIAIGTAVERSPLALRPSLSAGQDGLATFSSEVTAAVIFSADTLKSMNIMTGTVLRLYNAVQIPQMNLVAGDGASMNRGDGREDKSRITNANNAAQPSTTIICAGLCEVQNSPDWTQATQG